MRLERSLAAKRSIRRASSAGKHHGAIDGRALLTVDVLGVGEPDLLEVVAGELDRARGPVEGRDHATVRSDVGDFCAAVVLDARPACWSVLGCERDEVALAEPVVLVRQRDLCGSEPSADR